MNRSIAASIAALVMASPGITLADSPYHDNVYSERFFFAANHDARSPLASLDGKLQNTTAVADRSAQQRPQPQAKTREQVRQELRNMTAEEKRRMQELYAN